MTQSKLWYRNGLFQKLASIIIGALLMLALTALTAVPDIRSNSEAVARNTGDIDNIKVQLTEILTQMTTRTDLNRLEDNLKGYIKDLLKDNGGQ